MTCNGKAYDCGGHLRRRAAALNGDGRATGDGTRRRRTAAAGPGDGGLLRRLAAAGPGGQLWSRSGAAGRGAGGLAPYLPIPCVPAGDSGDYPRDCPICRKSCNRCTIIDENDSHYHLDADENDSHLEVRADFPTK